MTYSFEGQVERVENAGFPNDAPCFRLTKSFQQVVARETPPERKLLEAQEAGRHTVPPRHLPSHQQDFK